MPFAAIATLRCDPPQDLRDSVWTAANLTLHNGGEFVALIPTRYPGTTGSSDPSLLLARRTEFQETEHWSLPVGQRMLVTEDAETALMDIRRLDLTTAPA